MVSSSVVGIKPIAERFHYFPTTDHVRAGLPPVLLLPFFNGAAADLKTHRRFLNQLGHPVYILEMNFQVGLKWLTDSHGNYGLWHLWADEVEWALNQIAGPKVVFSMSLPSSGALLAISRRQAADVTAWIADGGPFFELARCFWNYSRQIDGVRNPIKAAAAGAFAFVQITGFNYPNAVRAALLTLPAGFPVLSIRGWRDELVPISAIEKVFESAKHIKLTVLALPAAGHLRGLIDERDLYQTRVSGFLYETNMPA